MTEEEYRKTIAHQLKAATTKTELREVIKKADSVLVESDFTKSAREQFFQGAIAAAQDNSATMNNSTAAQEIVNEVLNTTK